MSTAPTPDLSIILVNWNGGGLLARCLRSLSAATEGIAAETIVVDNGSTDGSLQEARDCPAPARIIELGRNLGFAAGNNVGLRRAHGRCLLLLNTDTEVSATAIGAMVAAMGLDDRIGLLGCAHQDQSGGPQVSYEPAFGGPLACSFRMGERPAQAGPRDVAWISGACMLARRELYEQIGGLDETLPLYYEDVDWCYRAHLAGWRVCWLGDVSIVHDVGGSTGRITQARKRRLQVLSESMFYRKHAPLPGRLWWLAANLAVCSWHLGLGIVRFLLWPRRRTWHRLCYRANELAAFCGALAVGSSPHAARDGDTGCAC